MGDVRSTTGADESGETRLRPSDLWREVIAALRSNRLRTLVSGLAVFVAAMAITAVFVVSATLENQVSDEFDAIRATSVRVAPSTEIPPDAQVFPDDAEHRVLSMPGVVAGGVVVTATGERSEITTTNATPEVVEAAVVGVDDSVLDASGASITGDRLPAGFAAGAAIAYVGGDLADRLGIAAAVAGAPQAIMVDGMMFEVVGILDQPVRLTEVRNAVVIPRRVAVQLRAYEPGEYSMLIETVGGAARAVADEVPLVLAPERADPYVIDVPPTAAEFRRRIEGNIEALVFAMAALSGAVGAISIASAAYSGVVERTGEFGLRRAIGAKPQHIRRQVVAETLLAAAIAGLGGEAVGLMAAISFAAGNGWVAIVDPLRLTLIPLVACALGIVAGIIPARTASRIDPAVALREG